MMQAPGTAITEMIERVTPEFQQRGWQIIRNDMELWQSASRDKAAAAATGEYVLIMDDDNVARPNEISALVTVAQGDWAAMPFAVSKACSRETHTLTSRGIPIVSSSFRRELPSLSAPCGMCSAT